MMATMLTARKMEEGKLSIITETNMTGSGIRARYMDSDDSRKEKLAKSLKDFGKMDSFVKPFQPVTKANSNSLEIKIKAINFELNDSGLLPTSHFLQIIPQTPYFGQLCFHSHQYHQLKSSARSPNPHHTCSSCHHLHLPCN